MRFYYWARLLNNNSKLTLTVTILLVLISTSSANPIALPITPTSPCFKLIEESLSPDFSWRSPTALSLATCLLVNTTLPPSSCVFYTSVTRDTAIRYAHFTSQMTIYDAYSPIHFNISTSPASHYHATGHLRDFFRVTSRAYAIACSGQATLVIPEHVEPCPTSIWIEEEYDAMVKKLSGVVLPVIRANWTRTAVAALRKEESSSSVTTTTTDKVISTHIPPRLSKRDPSSVVDESHERDQKPAVDIAKVVARDQTSQKPLGRPDVTKENRHHGDGGDDDDDDDDNNDEELKTKLEFAKRFGGDDDYWSEQLCVL